MFLILIGPSCSGKSAIAERISAQTGAVAWAGKDYLRLAKNESTAWTEFERLIKKAVENNALGAESIIYVVTEKAAIRPSITGLNNTRVIAVTAEPAVLEERFSKRTGQPITPPIAQMIERQRISMNGYKTDMVFDTTNQTASAISDRIIEEIGKQNE
jgi:cytidylate kinase